jgi:membrane-associated protein
MDHIIQLLVEYRYIILFPLAIIEGPVLAMIFGFLAKFGTFSFLYSYLILMAADLVGDAMWYAVGYYWGEKFLIRFGHYFGIGNKERAVVNMFFQKYHSAILIISKLTMGLGLPFVTLVTAGIAKINFKKYMLINFLGQIIWTGALMFIGFFLGNFYITIYGKFEAISAVPLFIFLFAVVFGVGKYIRKTVLKKYS